MKTKYILVLMLTAIILACNNNASTYKAEDDLDNHEVADTTFYKLLAHAINDGDFNAYNKISNAYMLEDKSAELFYYSFLMANKNKCPEAYYHLYSIINDDRTINGVNLKSRDNFSENISLFFLLKSKELGFEKAKHHVENIFSTKDSVPNSTYYIKKIVESETGSSKKLK